MTIIADSTTQRTHWVIVDDGHIVETATTSGVNPFFQTRREISHIIRLELPEAFFRRRWQNVYFYGSGCSSAEQVHMVEQSVVAQFRSPTVVDSDLVGAARGLLDHSPGIACILSTGSNSCFYDGEHVVKNVRPGGYILGDEGSLGNMGKRLLADIIKEIAPAEVIDGFYAHFCTSADEVISLIYSHPHAYATLASYAMYLAQIIDTDYGNNIVTSSLRDFFDRCIAYYDYRGYPLSFKVSHDFPFADQLRAVAADFGATIACIDTTILPGLIAYHSHS